MRCSLAVTSEIAFRLVAPPFVCEPRPNWPRSAQTWPDRDQTCAISTKFGFSSGGLDSSKFGQALPNFARFRTTLGDFDRTWTDFGQTLPTTFGRDSTSDQISCKLGPDSTAFSRIGPNLGELDRIWPEFGDLLCEIGQTPERFRPSFWMLAFGQTTTASTEFGVRFQPSLALLWANMSRSRPSLGDVAQGRA